jgi:methyltransferase (TIGR00027 family)
MTRPSATGRSAYGAAPMKAGIGRGLRTVVILGAGLDTRAYRIPDLAETAVFEVDLPTVQAFKKERLRRRLGELQAHVQFVSIEFNAHRLDANLAGGGLGPEEPAIFVWEGVSRYLPPTAVDAVLHTIAARPLGSELVFTYVLEEVVIGRFRAGRSEAFRRSASRRPWLFGVEPSRLGAFLGKRGLMVSEIERVARAGV